MGFRKYLAPSAREAMERIRKELGAEALILSNRRLESGRVEIIAAAPHQMRALVADLSAPARPPVRVAPRAGKEREASVPAKAKRVAPESFQEFIRRQSSPSIPRFEGIDMYDAVAREVDIDPGRSVSEMAPELAARAPRPGARPPAPGEPAPRAAMPTAAPIPEPAVFRRRPSRPSAPVLDETAAVPAASAPPVPVPVPPADATVVQGSARSASGPPSPMASAASGTSAAPSGEARVMAELQNLRSVLSDRITQLEAHLAPVATPPARAGNPLGHAGRRQVMTRMLMSGFSPDLARRCAEAAPAGLDPKKSDPWLQQLLAQQIRCPSDGDNPLLVPGAVALVGPTGVGKTTTIAKLAARFVVRHGAGALGLVTLDSYRIGAHEQLRSYGRILGVPVQSAHDAASLAELLRSLHGKRQVLIDTCGLSQRDPRLGEMLSLLSQARFGDRDVQRILLLNAASHAETVDEVSRAWRVDRAHGTVLTKIDEAARIGGALDALVRYRLALLGLTNGQRVPEDWHPGNPGLLAHIALKPLGAAFAFDGDELANLAAAGPLAA